MLDKIKLMSWFDQIREAMAGFQEFTHTLSYLSQIVLFMLILKFDNEDRRESN